MITLVSGHGLILTCFVIVILMILAQSYCKHFLLNNGLFFYVQLTMVIVTLNFLWKSALLVECDCKWSYLKSIVRQNIDYNYCSCMGPAGQ